MREDLARALARFCPQFPLGAVSASSLRESGGEEGLGKGHRPARSPYPTAGRQNEVHSTRELQFEANGAGGAKVGVLHFIGGEKGGVGKSVVARLLAQYCIDHKIPYCAFDGDASHGAMLRYYGDASRPVSVHDLASLDAIFEEALDSDTRVLIDLPAQANRPLEEWMASGDVLELARESGVPVQLWHVTDGGYDSVQLLGRLAETHGKDAGYVVARNHGRTRSFQQLDESETLAAVRALGGRVVDIPELHSTAMYQLDRHSSSFWAAVNDDESPFRLSAMDRRRVRKWLQQCYEQFEQLADVL